MAKQRISYVDPARMDADMRKEMERCQREGTPRPRARRCAPTSRPASGSSPTLARSVQERRARPRDQGAVPALRLARRDLRVLRNQRSIKGAASGIAERRARPDAIREIQALQRAAEGRARYAEAITTA